MGSKFPILLFLGQSLNGLLIVLKESSNPFNGTLMVVPGCVFLGRTILATMYDLLE